MTYLNISVFWIWLYITFLFYIYYLPILFIQQKLNLGFFNITVIWYEDQYNLDHQQVHCFSKCLSW